MSRIAFPPVDVESMLCVEAHLGDMVAGLRQRFADAPDHAGLVFDSLDQAIRGGKRLRAAILLTAFEAYSGRSVTTCAVPDADGGRSVVGDANLTAGAEGTAVAGANSSADAGRSGLGQSGLTPDAGRPAVVGASLAADAVAKLAAAIELFHASALVHDDLLDNSPTRRGQPAAHAAFSAAHDAAGWLGAATATGTAGAILLGDLALIETQRVLHSALAGAPNRIAEPIAAAFDEMAEGVMVGQFLDTLAPQLPLPTDPNELRSQALVILRDKSARYSVEFPLLLGAMAAGVARSDCTVLGQAGRAFGEAFQLRDDLLGSFGDPGLTGKPTQGDLAEGKRTVLVACALARLAPSAAEELGRLLVATHRDDSAVARMAQLIKTSGAIGEVEKLIEQRHHQGLELLNGAPLPAAGRQRLIRLAEALTNRQR